jgi:hypothetical protein
MNSGNPCVSIDPEAIVIFQESDLPFDNLVGAWLSDNPKYHEVSKNEAMRLVTFRNFGVIGMGTSPNLELLDAVASGLLKCPKCKRSIRTIENYKVTFTDRLQAGGQTMRLFVSDEVTLVCYKCGSEKRVNNWRDHLKG